MNKIPALGKQLDEKLPENWITHAFTTKTHRVIRVYGPARPRNLLGRPTLAHIKVFSDKIIIQRTCSDTQYTIIKNAVKAVSNLPLTEQKG